MNNAPLPKTKMPPRSTFQTMHAEPNLAASDDDHHTFTLYLIRHGEALHNTMDKLAQERAKEQAEAEGLSPQEVKKRMKQAQLAVLEDDSLFDAPLSEAGKKEAEAARQVLQELHNRGFPVPQEVLVSPLERAMQTANIIFPDSPNIHVREGLRERKTGRACDQRKDAQSLRDRASFSRFSMVRLQQNSLTEDMLEELRNLQLQETITEGEVFEEDSDDEFAEEDKPTLRKRTKQLAQFLMDSESRVIAAVTHKAFLRELERGTFGKEDATEFGNCEIRVYKVKCENYDLSAIERVH